MTNDEIIDSAHLQAYRTVKVDKKRLTESGLVDLHIQEGLSGLVHANCSGDATVIYQGDVTGFPHLHLREDIDRPTAEEIAMDFIETQQKLEAAKPIAKRRVIEAFAALYHLIKPKTDGARYCRFLIEKAFEVLELGPIPEFMQPTAAGQFIDPALIRTFQSATYQRPDGSKMNGHEPQLISDLDNAIKVTLPIHWAFAGDPSPRSNHSSVNWNFWDTIPEALRNKGLLEGMLYFHNNHMTPSRTMPVDKKKCRLVYSLYYHLTNESDKRWFNQYGDTIPELFTTLKLGGILSPQQILDRMPQLEALVNDGKAGGRSA